METERLPEELTFEEAMESLDSIVSSLEGDQFSLEQMVTSYERGMKLLRVCRARIDRARQRVESIQVNLEKGEATLTEFAPMDTPETPSSTDSSAKRTPKKKTTPEPAEEPGDIRLF
jgi:exodeoxyribonuclease VII small subunit